MKATKKVGILGLLLAVLTVGSVSALDFGKSDAVAPGSILISGSFAFGTFNPLRTNTKESTLLGGDLAVDYALPFAALTVGVSAGFSGAPVELTVSGGPEFSLGVIPIIARIGYHPDIGVKNLDVYALGKIGWGIGFWTGKDAADIKKKRSEGGSGWTDPAGLIYGFDLGVRYFFTPAIGVFAEGGYEYVVLTYDYESGYSGTLTTLAYSNRCLNVGVTFKLGGK